MVDLQEGVSVAMAHAQKICFKEVTAETVRQICALSETLAPAQRKMVADNALSIAEAYFCNKAWFRSIYAGDEPVGFVMLHLGGDTQAEDDYTGVYLWRFMIAGSHQGKGYGKQAIELIKEYLRDQGVCELMTSYVLIDEGAAGFYHNLGFIPTGKICEGEAEALLKF